MHTQHYNENKKIFQGKNKTKKEQHELFTNKSSYIVV